MTEATPGALVADGLPAVFAGRYTIRTLLGRGQSSTVYRAYDSTAGHEVALKVLDPHLTWDPGAVARLRREVLISRRVTHPGVVRVHDLATDGVRAAVVQELISGESLRDLIEREAPLVASRAIAIACGVLEALAACHARGVYHRDVKPSNVLVEATGMVRLIDFGIARVSMMTTITRTGAVLGTPGYQAPEVLRGERPDLRADLYGVGILIFEMLTGRPPFADDALDRGPFRQLHSEPPRLASLRPGLSAQLDELTAALLARHPELRPDGAQEVIEALAEIESEDRASSVPVGGAASVGATCRGCGFEARSAIPFCPRCGLVRRMVVAPGKNFVRLRGVDQPEAHAAQLERLFGAAFKPKRWRAFTRGEAPSIILARGVSAETAAALAMDARRFGAGTEVGQGWGGLQLREGVSGSTLALGLGTALLVMSLLSQTLYSKDLGNWVEAHGTVYKLAIGVSFLAGMALLVIRHSRPILVFRGAHRIDTGAMDAVATGLATRVERLGATLLGDASAAAVDAYWSCRARATDGDQTLCGLLAEVIDRALDVAERGAILGRLLAGRDVTEAARDIERIHARKRAAPTLAAELDHLLAALTAELDALEEAERLIAVASSRLVLAAGLMKQVGRALARIAGPEERMRAIGEFVANAALDMDELERIIDAVEEAARGRSQSC